MIVPILETASTVLLCLAGALYVARIARAPSNGDRILALDGAALTLVGYLVFEGDRAGGHFYLDAALAMALLSFVATIALAQTSAQGENDD